MATYVALIRGVNVGGVVLAMEDLRRMLEYIGFSKVRTYIQSGNALFESKETNKRKMEAEIADEIRNKVGKSVAVIVKSAAEIRAIAESHPLAELGPEDRLYVTVLSYDPAASDVEALMETMNDIDRHELSRRCVYSYYGEGYGTSKRSNGFIERILKVSATTRNWATIRALAELAAGGEERSGPRLLE